MCMSIPKLINDCLRKGGKWNRLVWGGAGSLRKSNLNFLKGLIAFERNIRAKTSLV